MSKRKPYKPKKPNRPTLVEVYQAFSMIDTWFSALRTGEIEFVVFDGKELPVFRDEEGARVPMLDAMAGWIECWQEFATAFDFTLDQQALRVVLNKLEQGEIIRPSEVSAANLVVAKQRQIYRTLDPFKVRTISAACAERMRQEDECHA